MKFSRFSSLTKAFAVAVSGLVGSGMAKAATIGTISVLGSVTQSGPYSNSLSVTPGEPIFVEIIGQLNSGGTNGTTTINSLSPTADGISSLSLNLSATGNPTITGATLASGSTTPATTGNNSGGGLQNWNGVGASAGTAAGASVTGIRPINTGVDNGTATGNDVIWEGLLTVGSGATTVNSTWGSTSGGLKINGGTTFLIANATAGNNDFTFAPLTLSVPEPTSAAVLLLGAPMLLKRRRQHS
jgi:hypothetical protein